MGLGTNEDGHCSSCDSDHLRPWGTQCLAYKNALEKCNELNLDPGEYKHRAKDIQEPSGGSNLGHDVADKKHLDQIKHLTEINLKQKAHIQSLVNKMNDMTPQIPQQQDQGPLLQQIIDRLDRFNEFFSKVGIELKQKVKPLNDVEMSELKGDEELADDGPIDARKVFKFRKTNTLEMTEIVNNIKISKSSGIPQISTFLLKACFKATIPQLVHLMNIAINSNDIPNKWKSAVIVPVHKSGSPRTPDNYRPISTLPLTTKILENCVHAQLTDYFNKEQILTQHQFGFRKNHSTSKAISTLLSDVYAMINGAQFIQLCFIDYRKAFDTVAHDILLRKLESVGILANELGWFENYLGGRTQRVKVNGTMSGQERVRCGVPQGSTLGPLLFLIYINDITKYMPCNTLLFADDTVMYTSGASAREAEEKMQKGLDKIVLWTRDAQLTVNEGKSKVMLIKPKRRKLIS